MKAKGLNQTQINSAEQCEQCHKPPELCVCDQIKPIKTKCKVLILQHPQEPDKKLGSARLAHLILPNSKLRIGLSWPKLEKAWDETTDRTKWAVLYVGSIHLPKPNKLLQAKLLQVDKKGKTIAEGDSFSKQIEGLIILDGTWSQAKTLWWRNAWLSKLKRCVLIPPRPSLYGALRREPRPESLSTIETLAYSLSIIEKEPAVFDTLLTPFKALLAAYKNS